METPRSFTQKNKNFESLRTKTNHDLVSAVGQCSELQPGTLYSLEPEQFAAKKKVEELGQMLAIEEGENLVKLRGDLLTNAQIAEITIPHIYTKYPGVAEVAVSYALGLVMGKEARGKQTIKVISALGKDPKNVGRLKEIAKSGIPARVEKYGEAEVFKQRSVGGKKSVELQGKKSFSDEEKNFIIIFCEDEDYKDEFGRIKFGVIADEINKAFWKGENIRNSKAIYDCYRRYGHKKSS